MGIVEDAKKGPGKRNNENREHTVAVLQHRSPKLLSELLGGIELRSATPSLETSITQVANDSRKVAPGALFVAVQGVATNGNLFAEEAVARGMPMLAIVGDPAAGHPTW